MSLSLLISLAILLGGGGIALFFIFLLTRNELVTDRAKTGGNGLPVIIAIVLVFILIPMFVFFTTPR